MVLVKRAVLVTFVVAASLAHAQEPTGKDWNKAHYDKREAMVPMRDGVKLFTSIYTPKEHATPYPILLRRTPYSCSPYGTTEFPEILGPSTHFNEKGYAYVVQDVRGAYMSEGAFVDVRPHNPAKKSKADIDESTDAWDTIEWLVKELEHDNGRVGMWGISYPGFYTSAGMIDAHPALKAASPQAPIADWWYDDFHHHGALFLPHAFNFLGGFGQPRPEPTTKRSGRIEHGTPDGYRFFLELGPLSNVDEKWFHDKVAMWNDIVEHADYDAFWQQRNLLPHLKNVAPAVMTVGGWYDAEDLYGALQTYRAVERQNPGVYNVLVMGPWQHGGWARTDGDKLGNARFGSKTAPHYRREMEFAFFEHFLRDEKLPLPAEANLFDTGANVWRSFDAWPPRDMQPNGCMFPITGAGGFDEFVSDPAHPVPFTQAVTTSMTKEYMTDDQRFVATRPDVLVYRVKVEEDFTIAGPVDAHLSISTTGTDGDWIVKLIDEFPGDAPDPKGDDALPAGVRMGGYQMMVRSEVVRGRYRDDPSKPKPFVPGEVTPVKVPLQDVLHTFKKGHHLMVHVQCTWFPLVDRNPQTFVPGVSVYDTKADAFVKATQRVWKGSRLAYSTLPQPTKSAPPQAK